MSGREIEGRLVKVLRNGSTIYLLLRVRETKLRVRVDDFKPYFYVPSENGRFVSIFGERLDIVYTNDPSEVPELRSKYKKHYEADIPYTRRFMIDKDLFSGVKVPGLVVSHTQVEPTIVNTPFRVWYIDIEVMSDTIPDMNNPDKPICAITFYDTYVKKYVTFLLSKIGGKDFEEDWVRVYFKREDSLLRAFAQALEKIDPDIIVGWNVSFDIGYLLARAKRLGIDLDFSSTQIFDLLSGFRNLQKRQSYGLKSIAMEEGFIEEGAPTRFTTDMSEADLAKYNMLDVKYMVLLDKKYGILDFYIGLKEMAGVNDLDDTLYPSSLIDTVLLRLAKKEGVVLPSKGEHQHEVYEGAIVFEPPKGIYENIAIFDMAMYYPSIILSFNISPENITNGDGIRTPTGLIFRTDREGMYQKLCKYFIEHRKRIEEDLQKLTPGTEEYEALKRKRDVVKYLINAIYGYLAFKGSRLYNPKLAETVTAIGREGLLKAKEIAERMGYRVIYGDTDSIMIQVSLDEAQKIVETINNELNNYFKTKYGLKDVKINMKFEKYARRILFLGVKKRYGAHIIWEKGKPCDYVDVVGLEAVRTDQSRFSKNFQHKLVEMVLRGASKEEVLRFIDESINELKKANILDIAISKGIDKPLNEYKTKPPHVRAAIWSNMYLGTKFKGGDRVFFVWVKGVKGYPKTDVVAFNEDTKLPELIMIIDWDKMIEINIYQKAEPILDALGLTTSQHDLRRWL